MTRIVLQYVSWLAMAGCSLVSLPLQADDQTVSGNLTVTGTSDLWGNSLSLGTHSGTPDLAGVTSAFADGTPTTFSFNATSSYHTWEWQQNAGASLQLQMALDFGDDLTLYDQSSTPNANVFLGYSMSFFANSVIFYGVDNEMNEGNNVDANSVLTVGCGDSRYISLSSYQNAEIGSNGNDPISILNWDTANNRYFSFGDIQPNFINSYTTWGEADYTFLPNNSTISLEFSTATGSDSIASGYSTATGDYSTAFGNSSALGTYSTALGNSTASGDYSTAMGYATTATSFASVAMGLYTGGTGGFPSTSWVSTDPLLEVSAGGGDAFVVYKNGNAAFQGPVSMAPSPDIPMFTGN